MAYHKAGSRMEAFNVDLLAKHLREIEDAVRHLAYMLETWQDTKWQNLWHKEQHKRDRQAIADIDQLLDRYVKTPSDIRPVDLVSQLSRITAWANRDLPEAELAELKSRGASEVEFERMLKRYFP